MIGVGDRAKDCGQDSRKTCLGRTPASVDSLTGILPSARQPLPRHAGRILAVRSVPICLDDLDAVTPSSRCVPRQTTAPVSADLSGHRTRRLCEGFLSLSLGSQDKEEGALRPVVMDVVLSESIRMC
jgi:hypothetical protein